MARKARKAASPPSTLVRGPELRRQLAAKGFEVSERTWHRWVSEGMPVAKREGKGGKALLFEPLDVFAWVQQRTRGRRGAGAAGAPAGDEDDPDLQGYDGSPALEEYRRQKARAAKRDNDVAEGRLVEVERVRQQLAFAGEVLKAELEAVGRVYGEACLRDISEAIARAREQWIKAAPNGSHSSGEGS